LPHSLSNMTCESQHADLTSSDPHTAKSSDTPLDVDVNKNELATFFDELDLASLGAFLASQSKVFEQQPLLHLLSSFNPQDPGNNSSSLSSTSAPSSSKLPPLSTHHSFSSSDDSSNERSVFSATFEDASLPSASGSSSQVTTANDDMLLWENVNDDVKEASGQRVDGAVLHGSKSEDQPH